jgi:hypothetical protein
MNMGTYVKKVVKWFHRPNVIRIGTIILIATGIGGLYYFYKNRRG